MKIPLSWVNENIFGSQFSFRVRPVKRWGVDVDIEQESSCQLASGIRKQCEVVVASHLMLTDHSIVLSIFNSAPDPRMQIYLYGDNTNMLHPWGSTMALICPWMESIVTCCKVQAVESKLFGHTGNNADERMGTVMMFINLSESHLPKICGFDNLCWVKANIRPMCSDGSLWRASVPKDYSHPSSPKGTRPYLHTKKLDRAVIWFLLFCSHLPNSYYHESRFPTRWSISN